MVPHQVDSLMLGTFYFFCGEVEKHFSIFLHRQKIPAWALQEKAEKLLVLVLVRPSLSVRQKHHCMSMTALEQGLLGLEAEKASDIDGFVYRKTKNALCHMSCLVRPIGE